MTVRRTLLPLFLALAPAVVIAQEDGSSFEARAGAPQEILTGSSVSLDASGSLLPGTGEPTYHWTFGDGTEGAGERVTHVYKRPGTYVTRLTVRAGEDTRDAETTVRVYRQEHLLLTDAATVTAEHEALRRAGAEEDILLTVLPAVTGAAPVAEGIARKTMEHRTDLERAALVFVWASGTTGPDTLTSLGQLLASESAERQRLLHLEEKGVILVTDQPFPLIARPAQTAFNVLRPQYVLLTRPDALPELVRVRTAEDTLTTIRRTTIPFTILGPHSERAVTRLSPSNALSYAVNALVNAGVPTSSIVLVLMLPVIVTLLAFSRQVIGINAFGIFTPAVVTLSFVALGLKYGLVIFAAVLLAATASRVVLRRFRLLYLPRMAIVLTAVSFAVLGLFGVGALSNQTGVLAFSVFPILLLASLAEQFVEAQIRLGFRTAARLTLETLLLSVVATLIVRSETLRSLIVGFPELILLTIPLNILLGRWTGLRLTEYLRFRRLLVAPPPPRA